MPAKLVVVEGPLAGTELWIEYEVLRFGSDAGCELSPADPAIEPHAFTVRYAEGRYNVYNRGAAPLQLDALTIAPSEAGVWKPAKLLRLAGGTVLRLETSGDGAPARRPAEALPSAFAGSTQAVSTSGDDVPVGADSPAASTKVKSNNFAAALGVLFAAAALFLILAGDFGGSQPSIEGARPQKSFAELIPMLQKEPDCAPDLWIQFSRVYAEAYRGDDEAAERGYRRLRDRIEWEKNLLLTAGKPVPEALIDTESFIKQHIASGEP